MTSIIKVQNIQYTDGDAALTIANGGGVTAASTLGVTGDLTLSRAETNGTVRLNLSNTGSNGSSEYSEIKLNSTAGGTQTSVIQHRNNYGLNIGTTTDHPVYFLQNNSTAMAIDANGYITKPLQPSISVDGSRSSGNYFTTDGVGTYYAIKEWTTGTTDFYGSGVTYDGSNGRFTVPVAGKYLIGYSLYWYTNGVYAMISVHVNGATRARHSNNFATSGGGQDTCLSQSVILDLAANDYIQLMIYQPSSAQHRYGMWHGHSNMHVHLIK
tara:strand:- start:339 stop:1145 length:807 start_codon:yes stop_codon:yes gene_type:complete